MKTKSKTWLYPSVIISGLLCLAGFCRKEEESETLKDIDNNVYNTVIIGTQIWIAENLRTTKYNDGTSIPYEPDFGKWGTPDPRYTWYNGDGILETQKTTYGALYNWYVVEKGKLCPAGWHVPSDEEWQTLGKYLMENGYNYDGSRVETYPNKVAKSIASANNWTSSSNVGAPGNTDYPKQRNATGFSAQPGGFVYYSLGYQRMGLSGFWWSSDAGVINIDYDDSAVNPQTNAAKINGISVRCIKDY